MFFFQPFAKRVAFLAGDFEVEHQILHIESKLSEGFLHEGEDATAAADGIDNLAVDNLQFALVCVGNGGDAFAKLNKLARKLIRGVAWQS
jgi:hypothetical protein